MDFAASARRRPYGHVGKSLGMGSTSFIGWAGDLSTCPQGATATSFQSSSRGKNPTEIREEKSEKVFAAAELPVLARNPRVDAITKDVIAYYQRCAQAGQPAVNFGYVSG